MIQCTVVLVVAVAVAVVVVVVAVVVAVVAVVAVVRVAGSSAISSSTYECIACDSFLLGPRVLPACNFFTCDTPGISRHPHPEREPCMVYVCVCGPYCFPGI